MSNLLSVPEATEKASSISDLPAEIVTEILLRLPARCLLICKSVCKPFFNLIKSPNFIYEHLSRTKNCNVESLLLNLYCDGDFEFLVSIDKNTNDIISCSYLNPLFPIAGSLVIKGSCNGLLCGEIITYGYDNGDDEIITTEDEIPLILLWNPATRQSRYLPKPQLHCFCFPCYTVDLAFGFVPETNDYKVVWIVFDVKMQIEVYRMSTDSWTTIEYNMSIDDSILSGEDLNLCDTSIFLNGAFHWGKVGTGGICSFILSFNLKDEEVWLLRALDNASYYFEHFWRLAVVDESLALIYIKIGIDIWVMNDYGVQDSWALRYRVVDGIPKYPWMVQYWTNGLELIGHGTDLETSASLYDLNTREIKGNTREIKYFSALEDFREVTFMKEFPTVVYIYIDTFFSYVETLVPVSQHRE